MSKLAYLGPQGTFCEAALRLLEPDAERLPCANVGAALDAARDGEADGAVVPLENSVEGAITQTLDELAGGGRSTSPASGCFRSSSPFWYGPARSWPRSSGSSPTRRRTPSAVGSSSARCPAPW